MDLLYKPCWSRIWIFVHWLIRASLFFQRQEKKRQMQRTCSSTTVMVTSRTRREKHILLKNVDREKEKEIKEKVIRDRTPAFLIERRRFFRCAKYAEIIPSWLLEIDVDISSLHTFKVHQIPILFAFIPCSAPSPVNWPVYNIASIRSYPSSNLFKAKNSALTKAFFTLHLSLNVKRVRPRQIVKKVILVYKSPPNFACNFSHQ